MIVKALSLWEPWASAMRHGWKRIETRGWSTSYRGPLLICASKRWTREMREDAEFLFDVVERRRRLEVIRDVRLGMAVALVRLVHVATTEGLVGGVGAWHVPPSALEHDFGDYSPGRFGWCTVPIDTEFEPFPVRGAQGLFDVELPPGLAASVLEVAS